MRRWKICTLLTVGTLGITTWLGYRAERHVMDAAGNKPLSFRSVVRRVMAPKTQTAALDRLNQIRHGAGRTELGAQESAECWSIIRGFSVEDVKAVLAEIPTDPPRRANETLIGMLFFRWAQLDPEAALQTAIQPEYEKSYSSFSSIATAWGAKDPEAALRWSASSELAWAKNVFGRTVGQTLDAQDPEHALAKATGEFPHALPGVIESMVQRSDTPEERAALLEKLKAHPDPKVVDSYLRMLSNRLYLKSTETRQALLAEIEAAGLSPEQTAAFRRNVESYQRHDSPAEAYSEILKPGSSKSEDEQKRAYQSWSYAESEKAAAWAADNGRTDLVAGMVKSYAMSMLRGGWQPGGQPPPNSDPHRAIQQFTAWQKQDPAAAGAWLKTMPSDLRNHLSKDHATR